MAKLPYEILIRSDDKGKYTGSHAIDVVGGNARAIKANDWPALAEDINTAALARVTELEAELAAKDAEVADAKDLEAIKAALAADDKEAAIAALAAKERPEKDKKLAALDAEIAAKQAERDALAALVMSVELNGKKK